MGLLIVGLAASILAGCGKGKPPVVKQPPKEEKSNLKAEFHKAGLAWADAKGRPLMEAGFKQALASTSGEEAKVELLGAKASLFRDGKRASSVIADRMVADSRTKEIRAVGGIRITTDDGSSARCERVVWNSSANKLSGSGSVRLVKGNITITADRFEADTGLKKVRFYNGKAQVK